jgi:hypothetical protein
MIDPNKLQYLTMAARLRGYVEGLSQEYGDRYNALIHTLGVAADLLQAVWDEHTQQDEEKPGGTD